MATLDTRSDGETMATCRKVTVDSGVGASVWPNHVGDDGMPTPSECRLKVEAAIGAEIQQYGSRKELEMSDEGESRIMLCGKLADPRLPTAEQRAEHNRHHLPFRSWCDHCVRRKGEKTASETATCYVQTAWLAEYSADWLSKFSVGADGRTPYGRWNVKKVSQNTKARDEKWGGGHGTRGSCLEMLESRRGGSEL